MPGLTIEQAFQMALAHHQAGRLAEAEPLYRQILAVQPSHADALHFLGVLAHQVGRSDVAAEMIPKAIALCPGNPAAHSNLGDVYRKLGRRGEAIASFRTAIRLKPDYAEAYSNLGNVLCEQGQPEEAAAACSTAIRLRPDYAEAHSNLGNALRAMDRSDEAVAEYRRALECKPDHAEAHNNLGVALNDRGRFEEAAAACRRALQFRPDFTDALYNLGNALKGQARAEEAIAAYRRVLQADPGNAKAHNNLGIALMEMGNLEGALAAFRMALERMPSYAEAHNNIGNVLMRQGHVGPALAAHRSSFQLKPDYAGARSNLLLGLHCLPAADPQVAFAEHVQWAQAHEEPLKKRIIPHPNDRTPGRRLRVGYVSPDFREHSVAYFIGSLLAAHDPGQVEVFCYADLARDDAVSLRLRAHAAKWRSNTGMTNEQLAGQIRGDGIDILVDLAGHTSGNRLLVFARKPAPVQVTYLGYCDTTGMRTMDCRLTDAHADPPGTTEHLHTEKLLRLPDSAWCFRAPDAAPPVAPLPARCEGHVTFGCFNARHKMNDELFALWVRILQTVPGSRLLLKNFSFQDPGVQRQAHEFFTRTGIESERVELLGWLPNPADHLGTYSRIDIALDTFPYHGTTTTCEALWMGVPVITLAGRTHASRVGVSLLSNVGLPELISQTSEEYVQIAAGLAADLPRLAELRQSLRQRMQSSPLMDAPRFARNVEAAYRKIWVEWCAAQPA